MERRRATTVAVVGALACLAGASCSGSTASAPSPTPASTAVTVPTPDATIAAVPTRAATLTPPTPTAPPTSAPTADPGPTPTPAPTAWGGAVLVQGTESCWASGITVSSPDPSGVTHVVGDDIICRMEMNDPRVSGTKSGPFRIDAWGTESDGAFVQWGAPRTIVNDGGTWVGSFTGIRTNETGDLLTCWFEGTGAYAGLSFFEWVEGPPSSVTTGYPVVGLIFPGKPPVPTPIAP